MRRIQVITFVCLYSLVIVAQENIWKGTGIKKNVELTPYLVEGAGNIGIIICPGGSYFWHDIDTEGHAVAKWLQRNGIASFVLNYRTAYVPAYLTHFRLIFRGNRYPDPQDDLRRAIRYVKENALKYGIDTTRIGAMGFSAGGHLVMSATELFEKPDVPAFVVPIYPVVTMTHDSVHKRSRRGLLGDSKVSNYNLRDLLSLEKHVSADCPPVFLVNCKDDPIVDYRNSELLDSALTSNNVPHVYFQYETGGHGFGASDSKGTTECREWRKEFILWINKLYNYGKEPEI